MAGNTTPIFSRVGDIQGGALLTTAAADYTGQSINNLVIFTADATNGGFVQRLRFKAGGTNIATVARVYINEGLGNLASTVAAPTGTPTGTPSTTGGTLQTGTYFLKVQAIDQYGVPSAASTESASVSVTGPTGSIVWNWTASTGAVSYRVWIGPVTNGEQLFFTATTNTFTQTTPSTGATFGMPGDYLSNNIFYGEISLPATTASATAATTEIDYPMNVAIPPGYRIFVGLGTTVAAGWYVMAIAGKY